MIRILPAEVANRIAAGEVVERPAAVVRELIDNALDAHASRIRVEIENGGLQRIRVTDDGVGMNREDAELCTLRHATSKIETPEDLDSISTKGFRGEALASIAAVSGFDLVTRRADDADGICVLSDGGDEVTIEEVGAPVGTRVTVGNLFERVPARRKFLKKPGTELQHIQNATTWAAAAHETVHFTLEHNGRVLQELPPAPDRLQRIKQMIGGSIVNELVPVSLELPSVCVSGFISRPATTRNNGQQIHIFVNDRFVRDRLVHRALMDGYRNMLPPRRYPIVFLFLDMDPRQVDVNVHPTKQEVRFAHESTIFSAVHSAIRDAWETPQTPSSPAATGQPDSPGEPPPETTEQTAPPPQNDLRGEQAPRLSPPVDGRSTAAILLERAVPPEPYRREPQSDAWHDGSRSEVIPPPPPPQEPRGESANESYEPAPAGKESPAAPLKMSDLGLLDGLRPTSVDVESGLRVRGQLLDSYILAESSRGLVIVDQHAAHERIRFEELYEAWKRRSIASQGLLIPLTADLTAPEMDLVEEHRQELGTFGLEVEDFGPSTVSIRTLPQGVELDSGESLLRDLLTGFGEEPAASGDGEDSQAVRALYTVACRSAVKFGDRLSLDDMQALVDRLATVPRRDVCPHGRPAILSLQEGDLRRAFERG